jgi:DNA-binding transcriptional LysR family regulator
MNLQQLRYFLATARLGSFSAAADELRLTQPGVSDQVRRLERELGMPLFVRVGRGLTLTAAGRTLRPHAERVLAAVETAGEAISEVRTLRGGQLVFGLFRNADYYLLPRLVADFHAQHPAVRLKLLGQNSGETAEDVRAGQLDAAIVAGPIDPDGLEIRSIASDEILYVSAEPAHVRRPVTIEQLGKRPLILYDAAWDYRDTTRRQLEEQAQRAGVTLTPRFDVEHVEGALALASQRLGDTLATRAVTLHHSFPRNLQTVRLAQRVFDHYVLIQRRGAPLTPPIRELAAIAERHMLALGADLPAAPNGAPARPR